MNPCRRQQIGDGSLRRVGETEGVADTEGLGEAEGAKGHVGTLALLTTTLGPQFAGGAIPEPSREGGQPSFVVVPSARSAGPTWRRLPGEV